MAVGSPDVLVQHAQQATQPSPNTTASTQPNLDARQQVSQQYERRKFLNTGGTENRTVTKGKELSEKFGFSEETTEEQTLFLRNYLERLARVEKEEPRVLSRPGHELDQQLLSALRSPKKDHAENPMLDQQKNIIMERDDEKIKQFLSTEEGRIISIQALEHQMAYEQAGLGIYITTMPPGEREELARETTGIRLGVDQGVFDRFNQNYILPWLNARITQLGERTNIRLPGFLQNLRRSQLLLTEGGVAAGFGLGMFAAGTGGPEAVIAGAATAAAEAAVTLAIHEFRSGVTLDAQQCYHMLNAIAHNPQERAYVKVMAGIDVKDYDANTVTAPGRIIRNNRIAETMSVRDVKRDILEKFATRQKFYKELGVDDESLDATPEQFLNTYFTGQKEQTNTTWGARMQEMFRPNNGGIRDTAGRYPDQPGFNTNILDYEGNFRRFMRARARVVSEMMSDYVNEHLGKQSTDRSLSAIDKKIATRAENGTLKAERSQTFTERKARYEGDRTTLQGEKIDLEKARDNANALRTARQNLQRTLSGIQVSGIPVPIDNVEVAINQIRRVYMPGVNLSINGRIVNSIHDRTIDINGRKSAAYAGILLVQGANESDDNYRAREKQARLNIDQEYKWEYDLVDQDRAVIEGLINSDQGKPTGRLIELQNELSKNTMEGSAEVANATKVVRNLTTEYAALTGWGITEAQLQTQTLDQLMTVVNAANTANPANGWNASRNNRPEVRMRVIHATAEANARLREPTVSAPSATFSSLTNATIWNLTENQLRTYSEGEITAHIAARRALVPPIPGLPPIDPTPAEIQTAMQDSQSRINARIAALEEEINTAAEAIQQQDEAIAGIDFEAETNQLKAIKGVMGKRGEIPTRALLVRENIARFTSTAAVTGTDREYTDSERTAGLSRGYYELLDLIFDYKNNPDVDRNSYFRTLQQLLPPDQLSNQLNNSLNLGLPPGFTLNNVFDQMRTRAGSNRLRPTQLQSGFNNIINTLIRQGEAL